MLFVFSYKRNIFDSHYSVMLFRHNIKAIFRFILTKITGFPMSKILFLSSLFAAFVFFSCPINAQNTDLKNQPIGFQNEKITGIAPIVIAPQDIQKLLEEDKKDPIRKRFAVPQTLNLDLNKSAKIFDNINGRRVYILRIQSDKADALAFTLENLNIGTDENIFVYAADGKHGYATVDKGTQKKILTDFVKSDEVIIEFNQPQSAPLKNPFTITKLWYAYGGLSTTDFNGSAACEINMACATDFQNQKRGVVRIFAVMTNGAYWGCGSLVVNTKNDGTPYILTAFHISDGLTPDYTQWKFLFNYEFPTCANSTTEPIGTVIQGCTYRAGFRDDDFTLLELSAHVPSSVNAYFNGWSRDTSFLSASTTIIHHPWGDVRKIARSTHPEYIVKNYIIFANLVTTPPYSHLQCSVDKGTLEPGSSGAPLFDANGRIVAQLHGADADPANPCTVTFAIGGRFAKSWEGNGTSATRLKDWLDPLQTNVLTLDGVNNTKFIVSGHVNFWINAPMSNVKVFIGTDSTFTDSNGYFSFATVQANTPLNVSVEKPDTYDNGVDATDVLLLRRHVLGISTFNNSVYKLIAADVDASDTVDATDLLILRRFILGINKTLPVLSPWRFVLQSLTTGTNNYPAGVSFNNGYIFSANVTNLDIQGVKVGDIDGSAGY